MAFGQAKHKIGITICGSSKASAEQKAKLLEKIAAKADLASLKILADLSEKPNVNGLLKEYEPILQSL
ncbi:hypothetical protein [Phaeocystidibacter marisrubri]|uniref:Uncharacterized protein n=1 Tax=Phaeocystidibacter marisrubri TaxID=1577780 RepID=A0A6L3ZEC7_9FLAO|nr:hypothetical protein [Phaeocystidibacter marisrubri]KAB2814987.1 hypothetical protein F8C82_14660 [Phaeocystidibacter marisrubri]GGH78161.1 hypothetical protein GCM10011318_28960 [Phaeocystidibacter marisrubri]